MISDREQLTHDQILKRMIEIAKISVTALPISPEKQKSSSNLSGGNDKKSDIDKLFKFDQDDEKNQVKGPSKLIMSCNLIEVSRIREEIV